MMADRMSIVRLCTLGLVLLFGTNSAVSMRTAPPDDIIAILEGGEYNKHHLPTYATANASLRAQKTIRGANGYVLTLKHYQKVEFDRIALIYKEMPSGRSIRVELNRAVTKQLVEQLHRFSNHYLKGTSSIYNKTQHLVEYSYSSESMNTYAQDNLLSAEIKSDPTRIYYLNYVRKSNGNEALLVTEAKGSVRRATILIPSTLWRNVSDTLDEFMDTRYNVTQEPPTNVTINLYIEGMSSFRAQTMDFHVDIYFSETWIDPRLKHSNNYPVLLRDLGLYEKMWHPDLYFANAKDAKYHTVTAPNFLVYIYPNGSIYLDIRISLVLNCMMDLSHYPLDQQQCFIRILSYAYDKDNLNIVWKSFENITRNEEIKLPDMNLVNSAAEYCDGTYAIGTWACARASFKMKREIMHHVLQSYIPTALIVVISWFSFWLDVDAVPGRVSLCITTLLTLATQAQAAKMSLPQVSYAKAIDVWMGTCMGFVFGVMIEFTVVNYISRRTSSKAVAATNRKRSSGRLLSASSHPPNAASAAGPGGRLSEFHNLLFDASVIGPDDPRVQHPSSRQDVDSSSWLAGGSMIRHHQQHIRKESSNNGYSRHQSLSHRQSAGSCTGGASCNTEPDAQVRDNGGGGGTTGANGSILHQQQQRNRKLAVAVDRVSRFIFPCSFILFNMLYWPYYLLPRM